jgi:predicted tellurium resistance membrane protein TerC
VVFTSNAFAVAGLRALYFLLAGSVGRFGYLQRGLAVLLVFIGVKMLISSFVHVPVGATLAVVAGVVGGTIALSVWRDRAGGGRGGSGRGGSGRGGAGGSRGSRPAGRKDAARC